MSKVSAKDGRGKDAVVTVVDYPPLDAVTLEELSSEFTPKVAAAHSKSSITVALQGVIRSLKKAGKSDVEVQAAIWTKKDGPVWLPGMRTPGKSKLEKAEDIIGKMTLEERKALLMKIQKG